VKIESFLRESFDFQRLFEILLGYVRVGSATFCTRVRDCLLRSLESRVLLPSP
jgi:hypothetical protein